MVRRSARSLVRATGLLVAAAVLWPLGAVARQATTAPADPQLPTARAIVDRFVQATGGTLAFKSVKSMRAKGIFTITGQQITGELEMLAARPNKLLTRVTVSGIGAIEEGYDGKVGWSIDPVRGPALVTGRELTERADEAWFDAPLHGDDHVKEMTVIGKEDLDGRQVYRLKVLSLRGTEQFEFFETTSGLQAGIEATRDTPYGIVPTMTFFRDYQRFGQLTFPARIVQRILGQEQTVVFNMYEFDTVPSSTFELPAVIKALIK